MKKLLYIGAMSALLLTACGVEKTETTEIEGAKNRHSNEWLFR
ncbi:hypothetical protein [Lysinibacillus fusiformis]